MTAIYTPDVGTRRTVTEIHMGWHSGRYEIRVPRGFSLVEVRDGEFVGAVVVTTPIRWHPAYWLWRLRHR